MSVTDLLAKRALLTPDREAILELPSGRRFTYAQLDQRANRLANQLTSLGVRKGDRISILAHNGVVYADLLYACARTGAIFAPLNWRLTSRELAYIINDCQPEVLLCGPQFVAVLGELRRLVDIRHYIALDNADLVAAGITSALDYESALAESPADAPDIPPLDEEDPCCILYTSGTTGRPKGAVIPHRQVLWNAINTVISWGLTEHDVAPIFTPMFHSGGLFVFLVPLHYAGGRVVITAGFDPAQSLEVIQAEKCTVILGVPTLFQMWMNMPAFAAADFSQVHFFISGGAPCPVSLIKAWQQAKGVVFRQGYGLTEVGTNCFTMTDEQSFQKLGSVGKPIFHSEMRLEDAEGNEVPNGETGELLIRGPHVCSGYWQNPEATAEAIVNGWFHTGDMARQDADGFYYIAGRFKDMIISGGENIYAAEVEAVFREHSAVADAALIGEPNPKWGETGLMIVVLKAGEQCSAEELAAFCQDRLARYKIPKRVVFAETLPYSPYGKVMKAELKKEYVEK